MSDLNSYCYEARIYSESTPGTTSSSWRGYVHEGEIAILSIDVTALADLDLDGFIEILPWTKPERTDDPETSVEESCVNCQGGGIQTMRLDLDAKFIKKPSIHVFGEHTFALGDWTQTIQTEVEHLTPQKIFTLDDRGYITWSPIWDEIKDDLLEEVKEAVKNWLSGLWSSDSE